MELLPLLILPLLLVIAAMHDVATLTIPNWISGLLIVTFSALGFVFGMPAGQIGISLVVGFGFLLGGMALFAMGWLGGGDAKLIAATALWFGWPAAFTFLVYTMLAGGAATLLLLSFRRIPVSQPVLSLSWVKRLHSTDDTLPYGVAIAIGGLIALPQAPLIALMVG